jgi:hypothetical protein
MSSDTIFMFAIVVYVLMAAGMLFTMREFNRITDELRIPVKMNARSGPLCQASCHPL